MLRPAEKPVCPKAEGKYLETRMVFSWSRPIEGAKTSKETVVVFATCDRNQRWFPIAKQLNDDGRPCDLICGASESTDLNPDQNGYSRRSGEIKAQLCE